MPLFPIIFVILQSKIEYLLRRDIHQQTIGADVNDPYMTGFGTLVLGSRKNDVDEYRWGQIPELLRMFS